ncbi:hypothetical protein AcV5_003863 [Taiwanofungus camphoratus]|nr:hypothetical protein AcV5_003863 [Antrodia cinnamomea]KAI0919379.1 hypothetical protein AcV7_006132 [Antrodia cinnamomea]
MMKRIDETLIPGSVYLVDVQADVSLAHAGHGPTIVLDPTPSNDVNDPLNWTRARKMRLFICVLIYVVAGGIATASLYSILQPISDDTGIALSTLNAGTGYSKLID